MFRSVNMLTIHLGIPKQVNHYYLLLNMLTIG